MVFVVVVRRCRCQRECYWSNRLHVSIRRRNDVFISPNLSTLFDKYVVI